MKRVSKELAQMLKAKGYDVEHTSVRDTTNDWEHENRFNHDKGGEVIPPELSIVAKWLRERHNMHVFVDVVSHGRWKYWISNTTTATWLVMECEAYDTHYEALSAGIEHAVKLIL